MAHTEGLANACSCGARPSMDSYTKLSPSYIGSLGSQQDIDREIAAVVATLCALRTRRNHFTPINALPVEVLAKIFTECMPRGILQGRQSYTDAARFMLVCRAWCAIGREQPSIWSSISCFDPIVTRTLIARSKMALIDLYISNYSSLEIGCQWVALAHLARTRTLEFVVDSGPWIISENSAQRIASTPAPYLVSGSFVTRQNGGKELRVTRLPDQLFQMHTPQLRSLSFTCCLFDWRILAAPSSTGRLTSLQVVTCLSTVEFTTHDFCLALNVMPSLVTLMVLLHPGSASGHRGLTRSGFAIDQQVALPNLQILAIQGPSDRISELLVALSIPKSTIIDISFTITKTHTSGETHRLVGLSAVATMLGKHGASTSGPEAVSKLVIKGEYDQGHISIQGFVDDRNAHSKQLLSIALTRASDHRGSKDNHRRQLRALVTLFCGVIWRQHIKAVTMQLDVADPELFPVLRKAFVQSPVYLLRLQRDTAAWSTDMLRPWRATDNVDWQVLFPGLEQLALTEIEFDENPELLEYIAHTLRARHELCASQVKPARVMITRCIMSHHDVETLRGELEGIATVEWDGTQRELEGIATSGTGCITYERHRPSLVELGYDFMAASSFRLRSFRNGGP